MRLGQAHGAGPAAVGQLRQVASLQLLGAVQRDRVVRAVAEARIHAEGEIGGADHLLDQHADGLGRPWPPYSGIGGERRPAGLAEGVVGLLEALRRADDAVLEHAALLVAAAVERQQDLLAEFAASSSTASIRSGLFSSHGPGRRSVPAKFVEDEAHVAQRGGVGGHGSLP